MNEINPQQESLDGEQIQADITYENLIHHIFGRLVRKVNYIFTRSKPEIMDVKAVAEYVDSCIDTVIDFHVGCMPIFYLLSDSFHSKLSDLCFRPIIGKLSSRMNVRLLGIEGHVGDVNMQYLQRLVEVNDEFQTIDQLIHKSPRIAYAVNQEIDCIGLEEGVLYANALEIHKTFQLYSQIVDTTDKRYLDLLANEAKERGIPKRESYSLYSLLREDRISMLLGLLDTHLAPLLETVSFRDKLPSYRIGHEQWYDRKGNRPHNSPFYKALDALNSKYVVLERSKKAVEIALDECQKRGQDQMIVMYGTGHHEQMKELFKESGASFIVLR